MGELFNTKGVPGDLKGVSVGCGGSRGPQGNFKELGDFRGFQEGASGVPRVFQEISGAFQGESGLSSANLGALLGDLRSVLGSLRDVSGGSRGVQGSRLKRSQGVSGIYVISVRIRLFPDVPVSV